MPFQHFYKKWAVFPASMIISSSSSSSSFLNWAGSRVCIWPRKLLNLLSISYSAAYRSSSLLLGFSLGCWTFWIMVSDSAILWILGLGSFCEGRIPPEVSLGLTSLRLWWTLALWSQTSFGTLAVTTLGLVDTKVWQTFLGFLKHCFLGTGLLAVTGTVSHDWTTEIMFTKYQIGENRCIWHKPELEYWHTFVPQPWQEQGHTFPEGHPRRSSCCSVLHCDPLGWLSYTPHPWWSANIRNGQ